MVDDESDEQMADSTRHWWQRSPWSGVVKVVAGTAILSVVAWGLGLVSDLQRTADAADLAEENQKRIQQVEERLSGIEETQQRTYDEVRAVRKFLRERGGE